MGWEIPPGGWKPGTNAGDERSPGSNNGPQVIKLNGMGNPTRWSKTWHKHWGWEILWFEMVQYM